MSRLPQPGSDSGAWGEILNEFLSVEHKTDGTLKKADDIIEAKTNASQALTVAQQAASGAIADGSVTLIKLSTDVQASVSKADSALQTVTKTDIGLANVDNTSDATKNTAVATLTNKTISGANNTLNNIPQAAITGLTTNLAAKADSASLATVATSGNYNDLTGKPTIPTAGTTAGTYAAGNDARLSDTRLPSDASVTYAKLSATGATTGQVLGYNGTSLSWTTPGGLTATSVKTANYTAAAGEYIPVNSASGTITVTLPATPADGTQVAVKLVSGANTCIVSRGGSTDVFNVAAGSSTLTLVSAGIGVTLRYAATTGIWYSLDSTPLSALNGAYAPAAGPVPVAYAASSDARFISAPAGRKITDFTFALADAGTIIEAEAATALTATVPPASSVAFVDNTLIEICQTGDGQVTIAPGAGVTLRAPGGLKTRTQWSSVSLRRRPGSGSTLPTANMLLRFKADDISGANGSSVSSWPESSGNNHPAATQATSTNQPTLVTNILNGHKAVYFDGINDFLQLTGSALDVARNRDALTVFIAYMYPSAYNGTRTFFTLSSGTSSTSNRVGVSLKDSLGALGASGRRLDTNSLAYTSGSTTPVVGESAVATARFVYSSSDLYVYKSGTLSTSNTNFQTNGSTSDTSSLAGVIGANLTGAAENFPGRIAEILVYGQDDDTMRTAVHTYFQTTYGIAMSDATGVVDEWVVSGDTTT